MTYFYDAQAWIPKNVTFVNKAAGADGQAVVDAYKKM